MRPYLAIIKDSFRAAMASRVLYVLLFLITVLLAAIAPLHMRETLDWEVKNQVNVDADRLLRRIAERHDKEGEKPIARIWELLPEKTRKKMTEIIERPEDQGEEESRRTRCSAQGNRGHSHQGGIDQGIEQHHQEPRFLPPGRLGRPNAAARSRGVGPAGCRKSVRRKVQAVKSLVTRHGSRADHRSWQFDSARFLLRRLADSVFIDQHDAPAIRPGIDVAVARLLRQVRDVDWIADRDPGHGQHDSGDL